jgi:acyl transferase domain-containing protein
MATAKTSKKTATKKATVKTAAKKTTKKTGGMKRGSKYACGVCGLAVTVDTACGCAETAHLVCCEKPMRAKR